MFIDASIYFSQSLSKFGMVVIFYCVISSKVMREVLVELFCDLYPFVAFLVMQ